MTKPGGAWALPWEKDHLSLYLRVKGSQPGPGKGKVGALWEGMMLANPCLREK